MNHMLGLSTALLGALILVSSRVHAEPPVNQYLPPDQLYGPPNLQQKPPGVGGVGGVGGGSRPGGQFGQGSNFGSNQYLPPNQQYGPPGAGSNGGYGGYEDSANNAPAKYEFEYTVNDPPSGNDFGHKESRDGDFTRGVYFVLLPDGRRQMVEYEADQEGYRPKITYTQVGNGGAGFYPTGGPGGYPSGGSGGYPSGGSGGYPSGGSGGYPSGGSGGYPSSSAGGYPSGGPTGYKY